MFAPHTVVQRVHVPSLRPLAWVNCPLPKASTDHLSNMASPARPARVPPAPPPPLPPTHASSVSSAPGQVLPEDYGVLFHVSTFQI